MSIFKQLGVREGEDRINEEVVYNIARAYSIIDNHMTRFLSTYNMSPGKFNILLVVKHVGKKSGMPQQEISKALLVTTSNMTHMIDRLEKEALVERLSQAGDRRVRLIRITKKGSDLLDAAWPHYKEMVDTAISAIYSNKEKKEINKLMGKFTIREEA